MEKQRTTTIQISEEVWNYLSNNKKIGEDFDNVLIKLLKINKGGNKKC